MFLSTLKKDNIILVQEGNYSVEMGDDGIWNYFITSFGNSRECNSHPLRIVGELP